MAHRSLSGGLLTRLARDRRGVSAVEFALLAPIMIGFYFGLAEFCQGYMAQKRMGHASAMVADLVAQTDIVTNSQLDDFFEIGGLIMKPFSASPLSLRVTQVTRDSNNIAKVSWSRGKGMTALKSGNTVTLPNGLIDKGESIIMAEAIYDYDSPVDFLMPSITRFSHTYYLRPRLTEQVTLDD
ncbi:MAG: pilus assembly protein [Brevundimonas sp.]|uniref:TadE/TadG family type IV pilus assembly protein n=1 Tax=Brevundimonas sp. TaxID=1871086 RepID=UPI0025C64F26|nr:TadE/TadG family type IV pilus assembly protein [Brevundimonas sp.]MBX3478748.1 pilus assembly protein [Brevundimonas sp.]